MPINRPAEHPRAYGGCGNERARRGGEASVATIITVVLALAAAPAATAAVPCTTWDGTNTTSWTSQDPTCVCNTTTTVYSLGLAECKFLTQGTSASGSFSAYQCMPLSNVSYLVSTKNLQWDTSPGQYFNYTLAADAKPQCVVAANGVQAVMANTSSGMNMCAAEKDDTVYYGPCNSVAEFTTPNIPYFTIDLLGAGTITGDDNDYLTDSSKAGLITGIPGTYQSKGQILSNHAKLEQVMAVGTCSPGSTDRPSRIGDCANPTSTTSENISGMMGAAYYLATADRLSTNKNVFPAYDGDDSITGGEAQFPSLTAEICIVDVVDGVCGAAKDFEPGAFKYSFFGWFGGTQYEALVAPLSYLAYRTQVDLENAPADTVLSFNNGISSVDFLDSSRSDYGTDVHNFTLTFGNGSESVIHDFVKSYTVGNVDNVTRNGTHYSTMDAPGHLFSRDIKIKASYANGVNLDQGCYLDYLFHVQPSAAGVPDGLNHAGVYFVYDPKVTTSTKAAATTSTSPGTGPAPAPEPAPEPAAVVDDLPPPPPIPPAPPPVVVPVTLVTYTTAQRNTAVSNISSDLQAFLAAPPPAPGSGSPPPPVAKVAAQATFPIQITAIVDGSAARTTFENDFKSKMAAQIGGGNLYNASDITIVGIAAGSVKVDWEVQAPPSVASTVANLVNTVQPADISITVNGAAVTPTAFVPPTVTKTADANCVGAWGACAASCKHRYVVTAVQSGSGSPCVASHAAVRACTGGSCAKAALKESSARRLFPLSAMVVVMAAWAIIGCAF
eukprot:COSAG01_NODE_7663_length_3105_cov_1.842805_1_plen_782_part_00